MIIAISRGVVECPQIFQFLLPAHWGQDASWYSCCRLTNPPTSSCTWDWTWIWSRRNKIRDAKYGIEWMKSNRLSHQTFSPSHMKNQSKAWLWKLKLSINSTTWWWWCLTHTRIQSEAAKLFCNYNSFSLLPLKPFRAIMGKWYNWKIIVEAVVKSKYLLFGNF